MPVGKQVLVVFFSRTGNTRKVAELISHELNCDIEQVSDNINRAGLSGWLKSVREGMASKSTTINATKFDPANYETVIIGTPIWESNVSSPIRTYINENSSKFKNIAFFCTKNMRGEEKAFAEMEKISGMKPSATLVINGSEIKKNDFINKTKKFTSEI